MQDGNGRISLFERRVIIEEVGVLKGDCSSG